MTAGLETFAKVRALHDGTTFPGERAAAAERMEVLALLNPEHTGTAPLTDREIARRVAVSSTIVGTIRRAARGAAG